MNSHQSALLCPQALLEVVNDLFEEQTDLEKIVRKIMQRALTLLQCERCSVLLLEDIDSPVRLSSSLLAYKLYSPHKCIYFQVAISNMSALVDLGTALVTGDSKS